MLAPFGVKRAVRADAQPHHVAAVILVGIEVPGSRLDLQRGDLVLPASFAESLLALLDRRRQTLEVCFRVDQQVAAVAGVGGAGGVAAGSFAAPTPVVSGGGGSTGASANGVSGSSISVIARSRCGE